MARFIVRRLAYLILVMLGASTVVFVMVRAIPGDPAQIMLGEYGTPEQLAQLRQQMGLDLPVYQQFAIWLWDLVRGDFGRSFRNNELIARELVTRMPATVELALVSLTVGVLAGILLGVFAATRRMSLVDHGVMLLALIGIAVPVFWIGMMSVMLFSVTWHLLPLGGRAAATATLEGPTGFLIIDSLIQRDAGGLWQAIRYLILPTLTLAWYPMSTLARVTRSSMLEVLRQDYIRTARAKGLPGRVVIYRHALRNALIPVVTVVGITVGPLVGGAVLTESVFAWPGLGRYVVAVVVARDFPAIQAIVFLSALVFAAANLVVDIAYAYIDPRIRYEG